MDYFKRSPGPVMSYCPAMLTYGPGLEFLADCRAISEQRIKFFSQCETQVMVLVPKTLMEKLKEFQNDRR
jgi:hypothetical protein